MSKIRSRIQFIFGLCIIINSNIILESTEIYIWMEFTLSICAWCCNQQMCICAYVHVVKYWITTNVIFSLWKWDNQDFKITSFFCFFYKNETRPLSVLLLYLDSVSIYLFIFRPSQSRKFWVAKQNLKTTVLHYQKNSIKQ